MLAVCTLLSFSACDSSEADSKTKTATVAETDKTEEDKPAIEDTQEGKSEPKNVGEDEKDDEDKKEDDEKKDEEDKEDEKDSKIFDFSIDDIKLPPIKPIEAIKADFKFKIEDFEENLAENLNPADLAKLAELSDEEKKEILAKKAEILTKLALFIKKSGLDVSINEVSGEIILNSSILFANDESEVSEKGVEVLEKFTKAYANVLCDSKYSDFVSKIVIEGHTDTNGSYDYNKKLSLERAENVKDICLSENVDISSDARKTLEKTVDAEGCAYDRPVKDADGNVDMDASRRVTFRFLLNLF